MNMRRSKFVEIVFLRQDRIFRHLFNFLLEFLQDSELVLQVVVGTRIRGVWAKLLIRVELFPRD